MSSTIVGADAVPVSVEVVLSNGMPGFSIVGLTDVAIQEARERVRAALRGCGYSMPSEKITVNLAPGFLKKTGSGFDLPIAIGLLVASGQIPKSLIENSLFVGELSLEGSVKEVLGMIAYQEYAWRNDLSLICGPVVSIGGSEISRRIKIVRSLSDFRDARFSSAENSLNASLDANQLDFSDIGGNQQAKRALQIAAAGNHGVLMVGPPGAGKTMMASRLPSILPPLSDSEKIQTAKIHSVAGEAINGILAGVRPFRSPHHSATSAGMVGGGSPIRPGEISLAHNGVLFLDEVSEFKPSVLQLLRKPLEEGMVPLSRAEGKISLPSRFMLIAASNPCPCGHYGDDAKPCKCSPSQISHYQGRLGGPLMDRIDMRLDIWRDSYQNVTGGDASLTSSQLRQGVMTAREFSFQRWKDSESLEHPRNVRQMIEACSMDSKTEKFLESMSNANQMSGRAILSVLRVSRTIADIEQSASVKEEHVAEALSLRFRSLG